jgi:hypothetical protein
MVFNNSHPLPRFVVWKNIRQEKRATDTYNIFIGSFSKAGVTKGQIWDLLSESKKKIHRVERWNIYANRDTT